MSFCDSNDVFCAALNLHNVYRTFGRHDQAIETDRSTGAVSDYNFSWYKDHSAVWAQRLPSIQAAMISLRTDEGGDRWGEWYHFFGILAYATRELSLGFNEGLLDFVVRMNEVLNPLIAGEPENPLKARFDRDSAQVAWTYLAGSDSRARPMFTADQRDAFVKP